MWQNRTDRQNVTWWKSLKENYIFIVLTISHCCCCFLISYFCMTFAACCDCLSAVRWYCNHVSVFLQRWSSINRAGIFLTKKLWQRLFFSRLVPACSQIVLTSRLNRPIMSPLSSSEPPCSEQSSDDQHTALKVLLLLFAGVHREHFRILWNSRQTASSVRTTRRCCETFSTSLSATSWRCDFPPSAVERRRRDVTSASASLAAQKTVSLQSSIFMTFWHSSIDGHMLLGDWLFSCHILCI